MQKKFCKQEFKEFAGSEIVVIPGTNQILVKNDSSIDQYNELLEKKA